MSRTYELVLSCEDEPKIAVTWLQDGTRLLDVTDHGAKHSKDCGRRCRSIKPEVLVLVDHRAEISHARARSLGKRIPNRKGHHCVDRRSRRRID